MLPWCHALKCNEVLTGLKKRLGWKSIELEETAAPLQLSTNTTLALSIQINGVAVISMLHAIFTLWKFFGYLKKKRTVSSSKFVQGEVEPSSEIMCVNLHA